MSKEVGESRLFGLGGHELGELFGIGETISGMVRWGKIKLFNYLFGLNWWTEIFDMVEDSETTKMVSVSPSSIIHMVSRMLEKTCEISAVVGEEIGSESIMEMLSEGLSSVYETNFNGAIQTILNAKRGSLPPDLSIALQIGQRLDRVERLYALTQLIPIGNLNYVILESLLFGAEQRYINAIETALQYYDNAVNEKNAVINTHLAVLANLIQQIYADFVLDFQRFIESANTLIASITDEHLARLNQLEDNVEALKKLFDNEMITIEEYNTKLQLNYLQLQGSKETYENYVNEVMARIDDYVNKLSGMKDDIISLIKGYLTSVETYYNAKINAIVSVIDTINLNVTLKDKALELYETLRLIRNYGYAYA